MPPSPLPADPTRLLNFALSSISEATPAFLEMFNILYPEHALPPTSFPSGSSIGPAPSSGSSAPVMHTMRLYVVRQPIPRKHRRSYIEAKDMRSVCGTAEEKLDPAMGLSEAKLFMRQIQELEGDASAPALASSSASASASTFGAYCLASSGYSYLSTQTEQSGTSGSDVEESSGDGGGSGGVTGGFGSGGGSGGGEGSEYESITDEELGLVGLMDGEYQGASYIDYLRMYLISHPEAHLDGFMSCPSFPEDLSVMSLGPWTSASSSTPSVIPPILPATTVATTTVAVLDGPGDLSNGTGDDDSDQSPTAEALNSKRRKKSRISDASSQDPNRSLPDWFRALKNQEGEIRYESWVIGYLWRSDWEPSSAEKAAEAAVVMGSEPQNRRAWWGEVLENFLEDHVLKRFVRNEVVEGRIGIDLKKEMDEKIQS
ncbi:hypothetical protein BGZ54_004677, partial [Gamsiella multidivaricata]